MADETDKVADTPERAQAERSFLDAQGYLAQVDERRVSPERELRMLAQAQVHLLTAIYHELRHGHDRAHETVAALDEHANAMDQLGGDMRGLGDAVDRNRYR